MSRSTDSPTNDETQEDIKRIIRELLERYDFLHEFRIQKLVYLADLVSKIERGERLTEADFKPYMYGSYSEEIRDTLQELEEEVPNEPDYQYGNVTTKYTGSGGGETVSSDDIEEIIERVKKATSGWSSEELGDWSKESWLYENTDYGSDMNFDRIESLREEIAAELNEKFPELDVNPDTGSES